MTISVHTNHVVCINPTYKEWAGAVGDALKRIDSSQWEIGDLLNYGETAFGDRFSQVLDPGRMSEQTVKNWMWVSRAIPKVRRLTGVSWSHHQAVAGLPESEQDYWLTRAKAENLSSHDIRELTKKPSKDPDFPFHEQLKAWLSRIKKGELVIVAWDASRDMPVVKPRAKAA